MGNQGDGAPREILHIRRAPALNRFLFFLNDYVGEQGSDVDYEEIRSLMSQNEKHVFHLILSAYLDDKDLQEIFSSEKTEAVITNISFILDDDDDGEKLSADMYVNLVLELGLIEHCLNMILADPHLKIMREVSEVLTRKLIQEDVATGVQPNHFDTIMSTFVKLSRSKDNSLGKFYGKCLADLLKCYVSLKLPQIHNVAKLVTLFRLIGVSIINEEDYQNKDELSVLMDEWKLDPSRHLMNFTSMTVYKAVLNPNSEECSDECFNKDTLVELDRVLLSINQETRSEHLNEEITVSSKQLTLSSYLGGCAYLIKMLLEKRRGTLNAAEFPNILKRIEAFVKDKPRMKHDEVIEGIQDFYQFCVQMKEHGNREIYKRDWIIQFLSFSVDEIIGTAEGNSIIEEFIIGAEYDLVLEFVRKVRQIDKLLLDDSRKELLLRIFTHERTSKRENQDFIKEWFQDGANDKLELENFKAELHVLRLQLGAIEFEKENSKLDMHEVAVVRICIQNPVVAVTKILDQSIRTEHFRALRFATPFLSLTSSSSISSDEVTDKDLPSTLIVACFLKLMKHFPDYPNSLYDTLSNSMEIIITHGILNEVNIFAVLKYQVLKMLTPSNRVALAVIVGFVSLLETLVHLVSDKSLLKDISRFAMSLNRFFCQYTNSKTFIEAGNIRNILTRIMRHLSTSLDDFKIELTEQNIENLSLVDQGFLFVRCDTVRPMVRKILCEGSDQLSFKEFIQSCVVPWILNCCEEEWGNLIDLIFNVTMCSSSRLCRIRSINKMHLLNEVLLLTYVSCVEMKCKNVFLQSLRFYGLAVEAIQKDFGEKEWYSLFETMLTIVAEMCSGERRPNKSYPREVVGLHQALSYTLSKLDELINCKVPISRCDKLISKLDKLPQLDSKAEPVRWLLSEKLNHLLKSCAA